MNFFMNTKIIVTAFCLFMAYGCSSEADAPSTLSYDMAEVYYLKSPEWSFPGFYTTMKSFIDSQTREILYSKFTLSDRDSLGYMSFRIMQCAKVPSSSYDYWTPRIVVFLHRHGVVDTLITNTYTNEPLQFNSFLIDDSTLGLYLTECVGKHDALWTHLLGLFYYNGNIHMLTRDGAWNTDVEPFREQTDKYSLDWLLRVYPSGQWTDK